MSEAPPPPHPGSALLDPQADPPPLYPPEDKDPYPTEPIPPL